MTGFIIMALCAFISGIFAIIECSMIEKSKVERWGATGSLFKC